MSWTDIFPVFTDEMVDEFHRAATPDEKAELEEWYGVEQVFNLQDRRHIAGISLFWKNVKASDPDLPEPTRDRMKRARELGLALRYDPWEHYVEPLLREVPVLRVQFPNVVFRVHLAKDLEFLVPDLVEAGCEVQLMKSSSIRLAPGALWRYLPLVLAYVWIIAGIVFVLAPYRVRRFFLFITRTPLRCRVGGSLRLALGLLFLWLSWKAF